MFNFKTSRDKGVLSLTVLLTYHRTAQMSQTHDEMTIVMHHGSLVFLMDNFEKQPGAVSLKNSNNNFMPEEFWK